MKSSRISILTIVKGRKDHLNNLLLGIRRQTTPPDEVVIVHMNQEPDDQLEDPGVPLYQYSISTPGHPLPLALARNTAAARAGGDCLLFLDVDCIPHPDYVGSLSRSVHRSRSLVMGEVRYLPEGANGEGWTVGSLDRAGQPHPRRPQLELSQTAPAPGYELFWSLTFGILRSDFERIGGFDTRFTGYGGEDTDFAFTAREIQLPFLLSGARVYHQHHESHDPPYGHLKDIVTNATIFRQKWGHYPMEGWLRTFREEGLIEWDPEAGQLELRQK